MLTAQLLARTNSSSPLPIMDGHDVRRTPPPTSAERGSLGQSGGGLLGLGIPGLYLPSDGSRSVAPMASSPTVGTRRSSTQQTASPLHQFPIGSPVGRSPSTLAMAPSSYPLPSSPLSPQGSLRRSSPPASPPSHRGMANAAAIHRMSSAPSPLRESPRPTEGDVAANLLSAISVASHTLSRPASRTPSQPSSPAPFGSPAVPVSPRHSAPSSPRPMPPPLAMSPLPPPRPQPTRSVPLSELARSPRMEALLGSREDLDLEDEPESAV